MRALTHSAARLATTRISGSGIGRSSQPHSCSRLPFTRSTCPCGWIWARRFEFWEKKHGVRIEEIKVAGVSDMLEALKTMPAATERTCFEASLSTVETGLPRLVDRAQAWASGNVERIESMPELKEVNACRNALDAGKGALDVIGRIRQTWLENIDSHLRSAGTTIAVVNLDLLLERGGLLDQLRAKGYEIDAP